jgi:hypothetical protein
MIIIPYGKERCDEDVCQCYTNYKDTTFKSLSALSHSTGGLRFHAMAPPSGSQLLWVNQDVKSYKQSKRVSATQAATINAHSQHQAKAARNLASQRALREDSAVRTIVGWRQRSVPPTSWSSYPQDRSPQQSKPSSKEDSESEPEKLGFLVRLQSETSSDNLVPSILHICGKDEALDPFNCTAAKIDLNAHSLIEFYLRRVAPIFLRTVFCVGQLLLLLHSLCQSQNPSQIC